MPNEHKKFEKKKNSEIEETVNQLWDQTHSKSYQCIISQPE
jgi:hypothetical protein